MRSLLVAVMMVVVALLVTSTAVSVLQRTAQTREVRREIPNAPPTGERYTGSYLDGKYNGRGTVVYPNGEKYTGDFHDNLRNGRGTYSWPDGRRHVGEFRDGQPNGAGTYTLANGEEYVGDYRLGRREGHGIYSWPDRRRYEGEFHDDLPNGKGILTLPSGERQVGLFRSGAFVGDELKPPVMSAAIAGQPSAEGTEIPVHRAGTNFTTSVVLNGAAEREFYIDSGATDVLIPMDVFDALLRAGTIGQQDVTGFQNYRMANGAPMKAVTFRIKTLQVGSIVLQDVRGSVNDRAGPPLLGMSVLGRFKSWTVDNERSVLILK